MLTSDKTHKALGAEGTSAKAVYGMTLLSLCLPAGYMIYRLFFSGTATSSPDIASARSEHFLMLLQCLAGIAVLHLPSLMSRRLKIDVPVVMQIAFSLFLFCAVFLGEFANFYYLVPHWDDMLHGGSGIMSGLLGCMMIDVLNRNQKTKPCLSPVFIAVFAFCFSVTIGAMWEIYEFGMDSFGLNMQKTMSQNGEALIGHLAMADTMKDIVLDVCGAFVAAWISYRSTKRRKGWVSAYLRKSEAE